MYELQRRYKLSLVIPVILIAMYVFRVVSLTLHPTNPITTQQIVVNTIYFIIEVVVIYILTVLFFSLETIIKGYFTDADSPRSLQFKNEFGSAPMGRKLEVLERYDLADTDNRITKSVILQAALVVFGIYAITSSNGAIGIGVILNIILQMLIDQWKVLQRGQPISEWFWQIKTNITIEIQKMYVAGISVMFLILLTFLLR